MTAEELKLWQGGQESILDELWFVLSEIEDSLKDRNGSYARGQRYIVKEIVRRMDLTKPPAP